MLQLFYSEILTYGLPPVLFLQFFKNDFKVDQKHSQNTSFVTAGRAKSIFYKVTFGVCQVFLKKNQFQNICEEPTHDRIVATQLY